MKRLVHLLIRIGVVLLIGLIVLAAVESQTKFLRRLYVDAVLDSRHHFLSCDQLPTEAEVTEIVNRNQPVIEQIKRVNPGQIYVLVDTMYCPGKADLLIMYPSHKDRVEIEKIINAPTFFGVPYRLRNI